MTKRYVSNDTDQPIFVGGVLIAPYSGREVDEQFLPPEHQTVTETDSTASEGPQDDALTANLKELLAENLSVIVPKLPDFSDDTLKALEQLEAAAPNPRKTLRAELARLLLDRAQARASGEGGEGGGEGGEGGPPAGADDPT